MQISETIGQEADFLGIAILVGAALFLLYDMLRIFRRVAAHGNFWIGLEDFFYWVLCTGVVFLMIYQENDGMARGFAFGGVLLGMFFYYLLLSRYVVRINVLVWKTVLGFFGRIFGVVLRPVRKVFKITAGFFRKQLKKIWKAVKMGLCKL